MKGKINRKKRLRCRKMMKRKKSKNMKRLI
jgi:hypothetical protein